MSSSKLDLFFLKKCESLQPRKDVQKLSSPLGTFHPPSRGTEISSPDPAMKHQTKHETKYSSKKVHHAKYCNNFIGASQMITSNLALMSFLVETSALGTKIQPCPRHRTASPLTSIVKVASSLCFFLGPGLENQFLLNGLWWRLKVKELDAFQKPELPQCLVQLG